MTNKTNDTYNKVYGINKVNINNIKLILTGEIDCIENNGNKIELKTKPIFATFNKHRHLSNWIQSSLSDTKAVVTGTWNSRKGIKNGPSTFKSSDIIFENLKDYSLCLSKKDTSDVYEYAHEIFSKIKLQCTKLDNIVYNVTNDGISGDIIIRECNVDEFIFPINKNIINSCAEVCISISHGEKEI